MIRPSIGLFRPHRVLILAALALLAARTDAQTVLDRPFAERVDVARVLIDARAYDDRGRLLTNLGTSDFAVTIGGRTVRVESVEWIGSQSSHGGPDPASSRPEPERTLTAQGTGAGRLVVFLVQKDFDSLRLVGLMQIGQLVDQLIEPLTRSDRAAVLSFDSRLRIWTDFTNDLDHLRSLLGRQVISGRPGPLAQAEGVSLLSRLDPRRAERIYGVEHALRHIAEALEPLPGAKSLVLVGYGFGRLDARSDRVMLMDGYDEASAALQRARVSVFTLNVTRAHYNSLQQSLQTVAAQTGGTYGSTWEFPTAAIARVTRALAGHYVLFVERPQLRDGAHRIEVRLTTRRGWVAARSTYVSVPTAGLR